jgi:thiol-disulfide isomerase/thioredoxin
LRGGIAMKKVLLSTILAGLLIFQFITYPAAAEVKPPEVGSILPEIILNVPKEPEHQKYLGLTGEGTFKIPEIKGKVVIFEIYSMYCPFCQKEAPIVNQLFQNIESNEDLKGKVKLIGIGVGNSVFEVDFFRKTYDVKFPLFSDVDFAVHKIIGEVRTPYFVGIKINADGTHKVIYSKLGTIKNADEFLSLIVQLSGL